MAYGKRKRSSSVSSRKPYAKRARAARSSGRTGYAGVLRASVRRTAAGVKRLNRMIETKESARTATVGQMLSHNNLTDTGMSLFSVVPGTGDPMAGTGQRIGDSIAVQGLLIRGMLENTLGRAHVHYRVMIIKSAKGDPITRGTLFKGIVDNKLIDQINTERYTIVASKRMTINVANAAPTGIAIGGTGVPTGSTGGGNNGRPFSIWIPGTKFGRSGVVKYEDSSSFQLKFYDYRLVILAYDWYGTPQDVNNVGMINSMYSKLYYKDA